MDAALWPTTQCRTTAEPSSTKSAPPLPVVLPCRRVTRSKTTGSVTPNSPGIQTRATRVAAAPGAAAG